MDLAETTAPKSDQLNADDLSAGPRTFTITEVREGSEEQPANVYLSEFPSGRPWKPSLGMRRVLVEMWGRDTSVYAGRRVTLFREPGVRFGPDVVGGVRISHMTDIGDKPRKVILTVSKGKRAPYTVKPLAADISPSPPIDEGTVARLAELRAEWKDADADRRKVIESEVKALGGES